MSDVSGHTSIFVCYNALSFEAALRIAGVEEEAGGATPVFLLFLEVDRSRLPARARVKALEPQLHTYGRWEKPFRVATWFRRCLDELTAQIPGAWRVFIPHPVELPGNHFLYSSRAGDEIELLPDGLINYFPRTMRPESWAHVPRYLVRVGLEMLAALCVGLRYRPIWSGHQTQYEEGGYRRSWSFNPRGYLTVSGELARVPPLREEASVSPALEGEEAGPTVLFLDQELHEIAAPALEEELRRQLEALLSDLSPRVLFYKAHPRGQNRAHRLEGLGLRVIDCTGTLTAERFVARQPVDVLVGFYSTSLVLVSEQEIEQRIAVLPVPEAQGVVRPQLLQQILLPLRSSGVRIVAVGSTSA